MEPHAILVLFDVDGHFEQGEHHRRGLRVGQGGVTERVGTQGMVEYVGRTGPE
jgi:hypothetical protein